MKTHLSQKSIHTLVVMLQKTLTAVKPQKFILVLLIGLLAHTEISAHASTVTRKWCGGFFHRKFVARAQTSVLSYTKYQTGYNCIGQFVGYANMGSWSTNCSNESKGCSRPQTATCSKSGTVYDRIFSGCYLLFTNPQSYYAYAQARHLIGGIYLSQSSSGRGSAGLTGNFLLDPDKLAQLADDGTSSGEITGDVDINDNNNLVISKLQGKLSVTAGADYFSKIKIVIIKEKQNITDDEALQHEEAVQNGTYPDVVYTAQMSVSKSGITHDGIFSKGFASGQIKEFSANQQSGVNVNDFSATLPLNPNLDDDEKLTLVTVVDGGFDVTSAVVNKSNDTLTANNTSDIRMPQLYPNPAKDHVDINIDLDKREAVHVRIVSPSGKTTLEKSELPGSGRRTIRMNTEKLLPGVYIVEIQTGSRISSHKLIISQ